MGLFGPCHIPEAWGYRTQKEENIKNRKGISGMVFLTLH